MARTQDVVYTYDTEAVSILSEIGINYSTTLTRNGSTAYIFNLSYAEYLEINDFASVGYGTLYYSSESQFGWS